MTNPVRRPRAVALFLPVLLLLGLAGCGGDASHDAEPTREESGPSAGPTDGPAPTSSAATSGPSTSDSAKPDSRRSDGSTSATPEAEKTSRAPQPSGPTRGIDASHHQGVIDWPRVAADDVHFAYLKATEGQGFTDPRFATNAGQARKAGIDVGAYHYFSLCSPGAPQADHFLATVGDRTTLPPVVDLELIGNCDPPPAEAALRTEVQAFIDRVEQATGTRVVVYFHPDFEAHYGMVADFDRRLWVRKVGSTPPEGDWWMWQRNDRGTVAGIAGPVDINLMR